MDEFEGLVENSVLESEMMEKELEGHEPGRKLWERLVPVTTAFLAVFATIAALLATFAADKELERRIERIVEDIGRNHALTQREIIRSREESLIMQGKQLPPEEKKTLENLEIRAQQDFDNEQELNIKSVMFNHAHHILAFGIMLFQVSIAISATALISRRRYLWGFSMLMMTVGVMVTGYGVYYYWGLD